MTTIGQLLDQKGRTVWSVRPDTTVFDAIAKMAEKDIGSVVVMDGDKLVGIFTERHYARKVIVNGKTSPKTPVGDIMEKNVIVTRPEQFPEQCVALMMENRIRHLPVLEGDNVVGIVSIGDLVKSIIGEFTIDRLVEPHIRG